MSMLNRKSKNMIIFLLIIVYALLFRMVIFPNVLKYSEGINTAFSIILAAFSIYLLGYRKLNTSSYKKGFIKSVVIFLFLYFIGIYGAGLVIGFLKNSYSTKLPTLLDNIVSVIITILATEIFRYVFISANKDSKKSIVLITILLSVLEINLFMRNNTFNDLSSSFKFISTMVLPIVMKNVMCSYLTYQSDYKAPLVYRCIMDVYFYILPLQPDLNDYVISILTLLLPFMIMMYSNRIAYERDEIKEHEFGKGFIKLVDIPFLFIVVFLVLMIMDIGPFKLVGIETGSMTPTIRVGDAVLIDKKVNKDKLKVKDIIAYKNKDGILVVHRIIKINSDGTFITKGDANNSADTLYVNKDQIKGKVKLKIPFIAYPKILFK